MDHRQVTMHRSDEKVLGRWFHITFAPYGAWLPGDPRGFRTRHHREHVEGDYKSPPTVGIHDVRLNRSRELLHADPVQFTPRERHLVLMALLERFVDSGVLIVAAAVSREHVHLVLKCRSAEVRRLVGLAKKNAWFALRSRGRRSRIRAKRCRAEPIRDRSHQLNAVRYVLRHVNKGAAVWRFGDPIPSST